MAEVHTEFKEGQFARLTADKKIRGQRSEIGGLKGKGWRSEVRGQKVRRSEDEKVGSAEGGKG